VYVYQDQAVPPNVHHNVTPKPALSFSHFPGNSYPGTIAPFHPEGHSPVASYFQYATPEKAQATGTASPYPWPMPNLSENPSLNK